MCLRVSTAFRCDARSDNHNESSANPAAGQIESNYDEVTDSFDAMNLKAELLRGVYAYGFERPSAIQQRAIMPVIKGASFPSLTTYLNPSQLTMYTYR